MIKLEIKSLKRDEILNMTSKTRTILSDSRIHPGIDKYYQGI